MDINLATWRYRHILAAKGGPLAKVTTRRLDDKLALFFSERFEAFAFLIDEIAENPNFRSLYGTANGMGTAPDALSAAHKAISEALERWAFFATKKAGSLNVGFDLDPTSNGFAAFPGLTLATAKANARNEALERWAICAWWEGHLKAEVVAQGQLNFIHIILSSIAHIAIVFSDSGGDYRSYGFACAHNRESSMSRALIELDRNYKTLGNYFCNSNVELTQILDQRLIWFAGAEGRQRFDERLRISSFLKANEISPELLFDKEIKGPWTRYAKVWRTVYQHVSNEAWGDREDYFFF